MNLEQLYYLGELIGVIAVVVSLIYVGAQVRQNTTSMRNAAETEYANGLNELTLGTVMNREFSEVWFRGESRLEELADVDRQRLILFEIVGLSNWRRSFESHKRGVLSDDVWNEQIGGIELLAQRQSVREAWKIFGHTFSPEFRDYMSEYIS